MNKKELLDGFILKSSEMLIFSVFYHCPEWEER